MKRRDDVTLCLTMGKRPEELTKTLQSLLARQSFAQVIAINDFRDEETNLAFRAVCPDGVLISLDRQLGHHAAVDHMYRLVETKYVFHCEDDWLFDDSLDVDRAIKLLDSLPNATQVCFRDLQDCHLTEQEKQRAKMGVTSDISYCRIDHLHPQWYGFSFNPHVMNLNLWRKLGGYQRFKKERHISRQLKAEGGFTAYMNPGPCTHIGYGVSVTVMPTWWDKMKAKLSTLVPFGKR